MKLQKEQIDFIRERLSVPLSHTDFIEEMTDHFANDIERQMQEENKDFLVAFQHTKHSMGEADGLVKMQNQYINRFQYLIFRELLKMYINHLLYFPNFLLASGFFAFTYFCFSDNEWAKAHYNLINSFYLGLSVMMLLYFIYHFRKAGGFKFWNDHYKNDIGNIYLVLCCFYSLGYMYYSLRNLFQIKIIFLDAFVYCFLVQMFYIAVKFVKEFKAKKLVQT